MAIQTLSQRDPRWKDEKLGFSTTTTIGSHGCTITSIAMLAGLTPSEVNLRLKAVNGFANTNLVIWTKIKEAIPWLDFEWRGYVYDNARIADSISKYGGCLVEVDFDGKISSPNDRHWVLYTGNQKMFDPWTGVEKSTSYYPITKGFSVIRVSPKPNDNPVPVPIVDESDISNTLSYIKQNKDSSEKLEGAVREWHGDSKILSGFVEKWRQNYDLETSAGLNEIEGHMGTLLTALDTAGKLRDSIEQLVGHFTDDGALLEALKAVKLDKDKLYIQLSQCQAKLAEVKPFKEFELLGHLIRISKITKEGGEK